MQKWKKHSSASRLVCTLYYYWFTCPLILLISCVNGCHHSAWNKLLSNKVVLSVLCTDDQAKKVSSLCEPREKSNLGEKNKRRWTDNRIFFFFKKTERLRFCKEVVNDFWICAKLYDTPNKDNTKHLDTNKGMHN